MAIRGRGPQVVLEGYARTVARGAAGRTMRENIAAMDALVIAGLAADGNTVDGSSRTGGTPYDTVVAQFPRETLSAWAVPAPLLDIAGGGTVYNARDYGCACDGVTDDGAALNAGLMAIPPGSTMFIPSSLYTTQTIVVDARRLQGASVLLRRPIPNDGASWVSDFAIIGPATLSPIVRCMDTKGPGGGCDNLGITRIGTPAAGAIGLQSLGQNLTYWKVYSWNHAIGIQCGTAQSNPIGGGYVSITTSFDHCVMFHCYEHHLYLLNAPETSFYDCRWGINGGLEVASGVTALITVDGDNGNTSAGGVNTLTFLRCQFNSNAAQLYTVQFINVAFQAPFKFIGCYSGGAATAFCYINPNCTLVQDLIFDACSFQPLHAGELFFSDPGHKVNALKVIGCHFSGADNNAFSLSGIGAIIVGNTFAGGAIALLDSMASGCFIGNTVNTVTLTGAFTGNFTVSGNSYGTLHNSATGPVILVTQDMSIVGGPLSILSPVDDSPIQLANPSAGANYFLHLMPGDNTRPNAIIDTPFLIGNGGGLTALPGGQAAATLITHQIAYVAVNGSTGNGVKLPPSVAGYWQVVTNTAGLSVQVYGSGTDTINGITTGTGVPLAAGKTMQLYCYATGAWFGGVLT